jgi:hypothetical protein
LTGASLPVAVFATAFAAAACGSGVQAAAGPVVGYVKGRGASLGWEAGGGPMKTEVHGYAPELQFPSLIARVNLGMSWRPSARELVSYAAWEPWYLVGGTLGAAYSTADRQVGLLAGVWEALPPWVWHPSSVAVPTSPNCSPCYTVTVAFGWRWSRGGEFYLAPKFGVLDGIDKPWPLVSRAD